MSAIKGSASAVYVVTDDELEVAFRLEELQVAQPVFGVAEGERTEKGYPVPIYFIESSDLVENGGRYKLEKGNPLTVNTFVSRETPVVGRIAVAVYLVGGVRWEEAPVLPSVSVTPAVGAVVLSAVSPTVQLGTVSVTPAVGTVVLSAVSPTSTLSTPDHGTIEYWYGGELVDIGPSNNGATNSVENWYANELTPYLTRR